MSWFESLILGLVQGLTEFLPVSSSAHLRLTAAFSGWEDPGAAFTAITQIGTETAVLIYFRKDIGRILSAWTRSLTNKEMRRDQDARMGWLVIVGSIPKILIVALLGQSVLSAMGGGIALAVGGVITVVAIWISVALAARRAVNDEPALQKPTETTPGSDPVAD